MAQEQYITCQSCRTAIPFSATELVKGTQFACPNCSAWIGIGSGSRPVFKQALENLDALPHPVGRVRR